MFLLSKAALTDRSAAMTATRSTAPIRHVDSVPVVDLTSVADVQNQDSHFFVVDCVDDPVCANSIAGEVLLSLERLRLPMAWCNRQLLNSLSNSLFPGIFKVSHLS